MPKRHPREQTIHITQFYECIGHIVGLGGTFEEVRNPLEAICRSYEGQAIVLPRTEPITERTIGDLARGVNSLPILAYYVGNANDGGAIMQAVAIYTSPPPFLEELRLAHVTKPQHSKKRIQSQH